jgi:hypothetical protein
LATLSDTMLNCHDAVPEAKGWYMKYWN